MLKNHWLLRFTLIFFVPIPPVQALGSRLLHPHVPVLANPCIPIGPQHIAVILAGYAGQPSDTSIPNADYVRELFLGEKHDSSIADFYKVVSRGKTWFESIEVIGPIHSPHPFVIADLTQNAAVDKGLDQWEAELVEQASANFDFSTVDRVVFITPNAVDANGIPVGMGSGLAGQGVCDLDTVNAQGLHHPVAHAWVRAGSNYGSQTIDLGRISKDPAVLASLTPDQIANALRGFQIFDLAPIAHELGHTFGLGHANQVNRPQPAMINSFQNNEILPAANDTLYELSYADPFSAMGSSEMQWFNVAHLTQLGWLDSNQVQEVRIEGTYRIYPLEPSDGDLKGLRIPRVIQSPDESTVSDLWVEYRKRSTVYDIESSGIQHSTSGAIVHYTNPKQPGPNSIWPFETVLLNFHPDGQLVNPYEPDLTLTTSWKDDHSMVHLEIVEVTPNYLDIKVSFER